MSEERDELRGVARRALAAGAGPAGADPVPVDWALCARSGWLGLDAPEAVGGAGATLAEVLVVAEELGRAMRPSAYLGAVVLGVGALAAAEPSPRRDEMLGSVVAGDATVAVALGAVAPGAEDSPAEPGFRLQAGAGTATVTGRAAFVPDAPGADHLLLLVRTDRGEPALAVVPADAAGLAVLDQPVLDETRRLGDVVADDVAIGADAVLPFAGDAIGAVRRLVGRGALALAADALGVAEAMLEATVAYAGQRIQFGRPIGSFQAVKHQCADQLVAVTVARELLATAVEAHVAGAADAPRLASMAKAYVGDAAVDVVGTALQLHGGIGYTWESGIHRALKRVLLDRSLLGSSAAHRRHVGATVGRPA